MKKKEFSAMLTAIAAALMCVLLIMDSEGMINAVHKSVFVCLEVIIPSLFAFMVFSQLLVLSGAADILFSPFYMVSRFWFRGGRREFGIFMLSLIGGYPVGVKLLKEEIAYNKNYSAIAEKMLCFCYCGSPTFIIQIAGLSVLGSGEAGLMVYLSNVLACLTLAVAINLFSKKDTEIENPSPSHAKISLSAVTESINGTVKALGVICGTILAFNVLLELLRYSGLTGVLERIGMDKVFQASLEISNLSLFQGRSYAMMPLFAAITSFGGFCIIMQTAALSGGKIRLKKFMLCRIPACLISAAYCFILTKIFPIVLETEAARQPIPAWSPVNPICSVCLIVMTFILLKCRKETR